MHAGRASPMTAALFAFLLGLAGMTAFAIKCHGVLLAQAARDGFHLNKDDAVSTASGRAVSCVATDAHSKPCDKVRA